MSTLSEPGPRHRVPVEHRVLGLDRRTFPFAITALVVYLLWAYLVPAIDDAVPWTDETRPGDVLQVTPDLTLVPSVGWGVQSGLRTTDRTAGAAPPPVLLTKDGVLFRSNPASGTGAPRNSWPRSPPSPRPPPPQRGSTSPAAPARSSPAMG